MPKKQLTLLFAFVLALTFAVTVFAQDAAKTKESRWEGRVSRSSKADSSLTVRQAGGSQEKTCVYDSSTKWVSAYHAQKKVTDITAEDVKDGDYVICKGTAASAGTIKATLISKRLSHPK
jgi:hypothetical protein